MKKVFTTLFAVAMLVAFAVSAMADGSLYSVKDGWYYNTNEAGILTVKDNKVKYEVAVDEGINFLGLQRGFTGQLKFVDFEPAVTACQHDYESLVIPPNCMEGGYTIFTCTLCGDEITDDEVDALGPLPDAWDNPGNHDLQWIYVPPTCTEEGKHIKICARGCGFDAGYYNPGEPALGHDYADFVCDGTGIWGSNCSRCDAEGEYVDGPCGECDICNPATFEEKLNDAAQGINLPITGPVTLTVGDAEYVFESNNGNYNNTNTLFCMIGGVKYKLVVAGNGAISVAPA